MKSFRGRIVVITGAGRGIGRSLLNHLVLQGARVGAIDMRQPLLAEVHQEFAGQPIATACADVTNADAIREAVRSIESKLGPTDILIANAGIICETSAAAFALDDFTKEINVNLIGVANSFAAVLPGMRERKQGHLAAISSIASYRGSPPLAGYCASKAGVNALCDAFRVELRSFGIQVTTICPGFIKTDIATHLDMPVPPPMLSVEVAAREILGAIMRKKAFHAFPLRDVSLVWLLRNLPRGISDWIVGRYYKQLLRQREQSRLTTSQG